MPYERAAERKNVNHTKLLDEKLVTRTSTVNRTDILQQKTYLGQESAGDIDSVTWPRFIRHLVFFSSAQKHLTMPSRKVRPAP